MKLALLSIGILPMEVKSEDKFNIDKTCFKPSTERSVKFHPITKHYALED